MSKRLLSSAFVRVFALVAALCAQALVLSGVRAQSYPAKPVRLIVPASPGAGTDLIARLLAESLGERLGAAVVVDNRGGASGVIGTEAVARAAPNGYTLLLAFQDNSILLPLLKKNLPYSMQKDFVPIAKVADVHFVMAANPGFAARTVKELIAIAKARPGAVKFSSAGNGGINHLVMELFQQRAAVKLLHVPYKGVAAATLGLITGDVDLLAGTPVGLVKPIKEGQLRGLAITSESRSPMLPSVPTAAESGLPEFAVSAYFGIAAPAGLPDAIAAKLSENIVAVASTTGFRRRLAVMGVEASPLGREAFARFLSSESQRWREVIERAGITMEDRS